MYLRCNRYTSHYAIDAHSLRDRLPLAKRLADGHDSAVPLMWIMLIASFVCVGCAMPGKSFSGPLPPLTEPQRSLADELKVHVVHLAGTIGHRDVWHADNLARAADYIEAQFAAAGLTTVRQSYLVDGVEVFNLSAEIRGESDEIVVVGAHYDSVRGAPGANDNASGVAAMLALAKRFAHETPPRTLRFVAFVNEEPPFFQTEQMGSLVYARACAARKEKIAAMIAFDTIGCYSDEPKSQHYPAAIAPFYPSKGNFIAFIGNTDSGDLVRKVIGTFRNSAHFPSEGAAVLGSIEGAGWSDHWSFWQAGFKAIMVTDTAPVSLSRVSHDGRHAGED